MTTIGLFESIKFIEPTSFLEKAINATEDLWYLGGKKVEIIYLNDEQVYSRKQHTASLLEVVAKVALCFTLVVPLIVLIEKIVTRWNFHAMPACPQAETVSKVKLPEIKAKKSLSIPENSTPFEEEMITKINQQLQNPSSSFIYFEFEDSKKPSSFSSSKHLTNWLKGVEDEIEWNMWAEDYKPLKKTNSSNSEPIEKIMERSELVKTLEKFKEIKLIKEYVFHNDPFALNNLTKEEPLKRDFNSMYVRIFLD